MKLKQAKQLQKDIKELEKTLKNCPFCGGTAQIFTNESFHVPTFDIGCGDSSCFMCDGGGYSVETYFEVVDMVEMWNRRAD